MLENDKRPKYFEILGSRLRGRAVHYLDALEETVGHHFSKRPEIRVGGYGWSSRAGGTPSDPWIDISFMAVRDTHEVTGIPREIRRRKLQFSLEQEEVFSTVHEATHWLLHQWCPANFSWAETESGLNVLPSLSNCIQYVIAEGLCDCAAFAVLCRNDFYGASTRRMRKRCTQKLHYIFETRYESAVVESLQDEDKFRQFIFEDIVPLPYTGPFREMRHLLGSRLIFTVIPWLIQVKKIPMKEAFKTIVLNPPTNPAEIVIPEIYYERLK